MLRLISRIRERDGILGVRPTGRDKVQSNYYWKNICSTAPGASRRSCRKKWIPYVRLSLQANGRNSLARSISANPPNHPDERSPSRSVHTFSSPMPATVQLFPRLQRNVPGSPTYRPSGKNAPPTSESLLSYSALGGTAMMIRRIVLNRNQEFGNHNFAMQSFQQVLGKHNRRKSLQY